MTPTLVKGWKSRFPEKDLKQTRPRQLIVDRILSTRTGEHFTADQLWERLRKKDKNVSKATVYRTLNLLVEKKVVEEHDFGTGEKYYERMLERPHHDHLICIHCGRIIEFENPEVEKIQEKIATQHHFLIAYHSHKLFGSCSRCHTKKKIAPQFS